MKILTLLTTSFLIFFTALFSDQNTKPLSEVYLSEIDVTQLILPNGFTVWLKPTDFETDEVQIQIAALGGFSTLEKDQLISGAFAAQIAWESGMGGMSSDQLSVYLYTHALDLEIEIQPFCRIIEGMSSKDSLESFFKCVVWAFTQQDFSPEGWKIAKIKAKESLSTIVNDYNHVFEENFLSLNTAGEKALLTPSEEDLDQVNFEKAKKFYQESFSNPADFICVVVGSFEVEKVKAWLLNSLGSIPKPKEERSFKKNITGHFPEGITKKTIHLAGRNVALTRMAFPLKLSMDEKTMRDVAFASQIIEARLRKAFIQKMNLSYGIDVSYEFPYYPYLEGVWISISYNCDSSLIEPLQFIIIDEMKKLQAEDLTQDEIEAIKRLELNSNAFWAKDNDYWTAMLTNYFLWKWDPRFLNFSLHEISSKKLDELFKKAISLENYSVLSAVP